LTKIISGDDISKSIDNALNGAVLHSDETAAWVSLEKIHEVCEILKDPDGLDYSFLTAISAVDYIEYFEIVYHLASLRNNRSCVIKVKCNGRENPSLESVSDIWQAADLQEREIWDLMGIEFKNHPNLKRILLWEGFDGHPLRKDFIG
jgi:NADH-quinone oxidoreductase subunit C